LQERSRAITRASLVKGLGVRDVVIALLEDAVAIIAGLFIVSRL
jgi:uncharacterized membrane protein